MRFSHAALAILNSPDLQIGIGRASAVRLSSEGWIVVLSARREKELSETATLCPGETLSVIGDIAKEEDIITLFERTMLRYGRLDLLFNVS